MSSPLGPKASPAKLSLLWARTQIPARKKNAHRFQMEKVRHEKRAIRAMESPRGKWGAGTTYSLGDRSPPLRTEARGARLCYQSSEFMASPTERGLNLYREDRGTAKVAPEDKGKGTNTLASPFLWSANILPVSTERSGELWLQETGRKSRVLRSAWPSWAKWG